MKMDLCWMQKLISVKEHYWCKQCNGWWLLQKVQLLAYLLSASVITLKRSLPNHGHKMRKLLHVTYPCGRDSEERIKVILWIMSNGNMIHVRPVRQPRNGEGHTVFWLPPYQCEWTQPEVVWLGYSTVPSSTMHQLKMPKLKH